LFLSKTVYTYTVSLGGDLASTRVAKPEGHVEVWRPL